MSAFVTLMDIILRLEKYGYFYSLSHEREDAIMITVDILGHRWEIEVIANGEIEIEIFTSPGDIYDESKLEELYEILKD